MFFTSSLISGANLNAEVLRGLKRGVIFRDLSMELHLHTHKVETLGFRGPHQQQDYQVELKTKFCEDFTITDKAPTSRAFSWLKVPTY